MAEENPEVTHRPPLKSLFEELCQAQRAGETELQIKQRIGQFAHTHGQTQAREYLSYVPRQSPFDPRQRGMEF